MSEQLHSHCKIAIIALVIGFRAVLIAQQVQDPTKQGPVPSIKAEVNEVIVPVVVTDNEGHAVGGLKKENFEILDNGKQQNITGFNLIERTPGGHSGTAATLVESPHVVQSPSASARYIFLVFDDLNLTPSDLIQCQRAATELFNEPLSTSDRVAVLATSAYDSGLTDDRDVLRQAILSLKSHNFFSRIDVSCPSIDYYQSDLIENKHDPGALEAAIDETLTCANTTSRELAEQMTRQAARRAVAQGEQNFRSNLNFLRSAAKKMGTLQGQRILVLVSPGFLTPTQEATRLVSEVLDVADQAGVTISSVDARGLYTTTRDSSERSSPSVRQAQEQEQDRPLSMFSNENVMVALAEGSGGNYYHNRNDPANGLESLLNGPKFLYMLAFSPHGKLDGRYHLLKVKVNQQGLRLKWRIGYFAGKSERNNQR